jgi:hypothetical protein
MKKPRWWTGWWILKLTLLWFGVFLIWLPVFSRWPNSPAERVLSLMFGLCILPFGFAMVIGRLRALLELLAALYSLVKSFFWKAAGGKHATKRV